MVQVLQYCGESYVVRCVLDRHHGFSIWCYICSGQHPGLHWVHNTTVELYIWNNNVAWSLSSRVKPLAHLVLYILEWLVLVLPGGYFSFLEIYQWRKLVPPAWRSDQWTTTLQHLWPWPSHQILVVSTKRSRFLISNDTSFPSRPQVTCFECAPACHVKVTQDRCLAPRYRWVSREPLLPLPAHFPELNLTSFKQSFVATIPRRAMRSSFQPLCNTTDRALRQFIHNKRITHNTAVVVKVGDIHIHRVSRIPFHKTGWDKTTAN